MKAGKLDYFVFVILCAILLSGVAVLVTTNVAKSIGGELDFKKREINGIILRIDSVGRSRYNIAIKESGKTDTLMYSLLFISEIVEVFHVGPNDSISKKPDTFSTTFYKKKGNKYYECCRYH